MAKCLSCKNMSGLTFILILNIAAVALTENVPVLMWSQSRSLSDLPEPFVGNTVDENTFQDSYLSPLTNTYGNHLVMFIQDKLNIDDFAKYADIYNPFSNGGAFKNIKSLMEDNFSVHLPSVKTPSTALQTLQSQYQGRVHHVKSAEDISGLPLKDGKSYLVLVRLPHTTHSGDEEKAFTQNDAIVQDVVKELSKRSIKYTAIYTGETSQQKPVDMSHTGRRLLEVVPLNESIFINVTDGNDTSMYFYTQNIQFFIRDKEGNSILNLTMPIEEDRRSIQGSGFENSTARLVVTFGDVSPANSSLKYSFTFKFVAKQNKAGKLIVSNFTVTLLNGTDNNNPIYEDQMMNIKNQYLDFPSEFSYHCSNFYIRQLGKNNKTDDVTYAVLRFVRLQFQAFTIMNDQFSDSWDCVTFFTTGIWMALFYGAIFMFILYYGMYMMFQLSTMDRFDDPKGKTITVNVSE